MSCLACYLPLLYPWSLTACAFEQVARAAAWMLTRSAKICPAPLPHLLPFCCRSQRQKATNCPLESLCAVEKIAVLQHICETVTLSEKARFAFARRRSGVRLPCGPPGGRRPGRAGYGDRPESGQLCREPRVQPRSDTGERLRDFLDLQTEFAAVTAQLGWPSPTDVPRAATRRIVAVIRPVGPAV